MQASQQPYSAPPGIDLLEGVATPKAIDLRREDLAELHRNLPMASLAALGTSLAAALLPPPATSSALLAGLLLPGLLTAGTLRLFGHSLAPLLAHPEPQPPLGIATGAQRFEKVALLLTLTNALLAGILTAECTTETFRQLLPLLFTGATLVALLLGTWPTPCFYLMLAPTLWALLWMGLNTDRLDNALIVQALLIAALHGVVATALLRQSRLRRLQRLRDARVIDYLHNECGHLARRNQRLGLDLDDRERLRQSLEEERQRLDGMLQDRQRELAELQVALGQQGKLRKSISHALVRSQSRLAQAIEAAELALWDWDIENDTVYQSFMHWAFGAPEMSGKAYLAQMRQVVPEPYLAQMRETMLRCLKGQNSIYKFQYPIKTGSGPLIWIEDCGKPVAFHPQNGKVTRMLGTRRNVTAERQKNEQLVLAKAVFDNTSEGIFVLDETLRFLAVNRAFTQITGYSSDDVIGRKITDITAIPQKTRVFERIREALLCQGSWQGELWERRKQGDYFIEALQMKAIADQAGHITHYTGLFTDLTEKKLVDEKLQHLLHYDDLTGLANRVLFRERLQGLLEQMRGGPQGLALIQVDIDRFRQINESLGQETGDEVLKQAALRIARVVQEGDTVARLGSDEFALLLPGKQMQEAGFLGERVLDELKVPFTVGDQELFISSSLGITLAPQDGLEPHTLMQQVNMAVRQAKYLGGNRLEFYSKGLQSLTVKRLDIETELRRGLQKEQFEVYFQPQYSLARKRIVGVEALVRWMHPEKGLINPLDFVPVAEESGLITAIGEMVLRTACSQSVAWSRAGLGNIRVSVNLSAYQFRQHDLVEVVERSLQDTGLAPAMLDLELTESALMENLARTTYTLTRFRQMGIQITIDDFGTGYSSLAYLKRFPINALKVDRVFVQDAQNSQGDASIIRAIILLGKSLGMEVIAEGVETAEQMRFLEEQSCDLVQGYLISHPLKPSLMLQLLESQTPRAICS